MLREGRVRAAIKKFGRVVVNDEIARMIYHGLADKALNAARTIRNHQLATTAAKVVRNSGAYSAQSKKLAKKYPA